jgi:hypothetical protein
MAATEIIKRTYAPSAMVGKIYAAPYGGSAPLMPIGNVLTAQTEQTEHVQKQDDMTVLGGGTHAEIRRITGVSFSASIADLNIVNLARAVLGTIDPQDAGTVSGLKVTARLGALIALDHIDVSGLTVMDAAVPVLAAGNWELRPEGLWINADAKDIAEGDELTIGYDYADQVVIEAITTKTPELRLRFAGLNEADSGRSVIVDLWRVSQGVAKQLSLIKSGFGALEITGEVLKDPNITGAGISPYMRTIHV